MTPGFLVYRKFGPLFLEDLRFPDGDKHKFAHYACAEDTGLRIDELALDKCLIPGCDDQFYCNDPETSEGCLFFQSGYFRSVKSRYVFERERVAAVHWACARYYYEWEMFENIVKGIDDAGFIDARPA